MAKKKFIIGLFILAGSIIAGHYISMPDFLSGLLKGCGIGILLVAFLKKRPASNAG
ncbi:MAG: hypothetical protein ACTHK8_15975 [Ginsengibacter sp.]